MSGVRRIKPCQRKIALSEHRPDERSNPAPTLFKSAESTNDFAACGYDAT